MFKKNNCITGHNSRQVGVIEKSAVLDRISIVDLCNHNQFTQKAE